MDKIIDALKFIKDNGSLFYDPEKEQFVCIFVVGLNADFEYAGVGDTPEEAAIDFLYNQVELIEFYHAKYLEKREIDE